MVIILGNKKSPAYAGQSFKRYAATMELLLFSKSSR
jgi:hypothetical protein